MPKPQLIKGMLGSSATPILHPNIRTKSGLVLYDGGIRDVSPIRQAIQLGADEIDLVLTMSPQLTKWDASGPDRVWNTGLRVFEIMFREIVETDLDRVELYNAAVESRHPKGVGKRIVKIRVIRPTEPLPGDAAQFEPVQTADLMAIGRRDAENHKGW
jgi:predicted patatin/cPLA2 family phospholipase